MNSEFVLVKIKEIAEIYSGNSINEKVKATKYTGLDTGIDYISTKDISFDSQINYSNGIKIPYEEVQNFKRAPKDTVFICAEGGSAGRKIAISDRELFFVNKLFAVVARNSVLPKYLYYYFKSEEFVEQFKGSMTGIIGGVSINKFKELDVKLPPLSTQQKIVAKLDAIFAEIDKATAMAEANSKNAEALFKSYLSKVLTANSEEWKTVSFGEVLVKTENINPEKEPSRVFQYVDVSSISKELLKITEPQRILGKDAPSRARKLIKKDDVLFATVRPTLRRIALVPEELDGEVCSTGYFVLRSNGEILQKFIFYSLLRSEFMDVMEKIQTGASYPAVNDKQVLEQIISFPSLDVQRLKVTKLDFISEEVKKSIKSYTEKINEFTTLKQSILRKAFAGELVKE